MMYKINMKETLIYLLYKNIKVTNNIKIFDIDNSWYSCNAQYNKHNNHFTSIRRTKKRVL